MKILLKTKLFLSCGKQIKLISDQFLMLGGLFHLKTLIFKLLGTV